MGASLLALAKSIYYHNAISLELSKPAWKWHVRREKHLQSLDPRLPNKRNLVCSISDQMVLLTDVIHGKSKFYAFNEEMIFESTRGDYL